ncbi:MAG: 8-amino-7-oxononanoate synthase [Planctomycetota bacterium]
MLSEWIRPVLEDLRAKSLLRGLVTVEGAQGPRLAIHGRTLVNAASNNALGLAHDPRVCEAAIRATERFGAGGGASRLVSGHMAVHEALEARLAAFKGAQAAILFPTGYMANLGTISALVGTADAVILDKLSHASLIDGARLSGARVRSYPHCDLDRLSVLLRKEEGRRVLVATDSLFSMDGDLAPLREIVGLCERHDAVLMADEAHATGVLGERGRGAVELLGLEGRVPVMMGTLSKSLGSLGGFVAGSAELIRFLRNRARAFIYTTASPPGVAAAALEALKIVEEEPWRGRAACARAKKLWQGLVEAGFIPAGSPLPAAHILPVVAGSVEAALALAEHLFRSGVFAPAIRPPTVPAGTARIRLSLMATHTEEDVGQILRAFRSWRNLR